MFSTLEYKWVENKTLETNLPNNGSAEVTIPSISVTCQYPTSNALQLRVCPIAIKVLLATTSPSIEYKLPNGIGQWSGVGFLKGTESDINLRYACGNWSKADRESSRLNNLIPCPPTLTLARFDLVYQELQQTSTVEGSRYPHISMELFHPDSHACFNEAV